MNVEEKIREIIFELSGETVEDVSDALERDLMLDSLSMVTLLIEIEEMFEIELDEKDMNPFELITVEDVVKMVEKYIGDENE